MVTARVDQVSVPYLIVRPTLLSSPANAKPMLRFMRFLTLVAFAAILSGCRTYPDSWQTVSVQTGKAWHNAACQQTAFDTNGDGRIDRLRQWIGSGTARELHDTDRDGWFDDLVFLTYEREVERRPERLKALAVPVTGNSGAFELPR
jgi:hypothetical protein